MKSKLTLFLLIVLTCVSCISNSSKEETLIPNNWKSLDDLQGTWIKIERDSNGYLLYHPCDGRTPGLTISNDSLTLKDQLEQPIVLPIDKIFIANDSITINSNSPKLTAEFVFKLVKPNANYILFKWNYPQYQNSGKQIITREVIAKNLRSIKNPCDEEKSPEHQFLPVEYN